MKRQFRRWGIKRSQAGMTLVEMLITISLLGSVMAGTLTLFSGILKTTQQRDTMARMIGDADRILAMVEQDLRQAVAINPNYALAGTYTLIAALPRAKHDNAQPQTIVYAFDAARPKRLLRLVVIDDVYVSELADGVTNLTLRQTHETLITIELSLEHVIAGETKTWQISTAFAAPAGN